MMSIPLPPLPGYPELAKSLGPVTTNLLCVTRWKDGIDIEEPDAALIAFLRARDLEIVRLVLEDARPEPDCRTCASSCSMDGRAVCILPRKHCANGDRYEPLPPVRLWRTAP